MLTSCLSHFFQISLERHLCVAYGNAWERRMGVSFWATLLAHSDTAMLHAVRMNKLTLLVLTVGSFEITPVPLQGASSRTLSNPPRTLSWRKMDLEGSYSDLLLICSVYQLKTKLLSWSLLFPTEQKANQPRLVLPALLSNLVMNLAQPVEEGWGSWLIKSGGSFAPDSYLKKRKGPLLPLSSIP